MIMSLQIDALNQRRTMTSCAMQIKKGRKHADNE